MMAQSPEYPDLPWMPPRSWTDANRTAVQLIVIHTKGDEAMEERVGQQVKPAFTQALGGMLAWPGLLRKVARQSPGFNT